MFALPVTTLTPSVSDNTIRSAAEVVFSCLYLYHRCLVSAVMHTIVTVTPYGLFVGSAAGN
jgi:hypothetical protein